MLGQIHKLPQPQRFAQHRRWLKTSFAISSKHLEYGIESKKDASFRERIAWNSIAPRSNYFTTVEPDRELRWVAFVITALALFASLRGGPQPITLMLYGGTALAAFVAIWLTRGMRRVSYTAIPASGANVLVLADAQQDAIVAAIEAQRTAALATSAEPAKGMTIRQYLRRLRWLVEHGAMTPGEYERRQKLVLPDETRRLIALPPAPNETLRFRQSRLGTTIDIDLLPDRIAYRRSTLFRGADGFGVAYKDLPRPSELFDTDHQFELTAVLFGWCAILALSFAGFAVQGHDNGYYVGGEGLRRAISDFGPSLLAMLAAAAVVPAATRLRQARPYAGLTLLRDKQYEAILAEIEQRRIAALRQLVEPDLLLTFEEQARVLGELRHDEVISDEEYDRAVKRAEFACNNPALDQPVMGDAVSAREYAMH